MVRGQRRGADEDDEEGKVDNKRPRPAHSPPATVPAAAQGYVGAPEAREISWLHAREPPPSCVCWETGEAAAVPDNWCGGSCLPGCAS